MTKLSKQAWEEAIIQKYGSLEIYKKMVYTPKRLKRLREVGYKKGNVPHNRKVKE